MFSGTQPTGCARELQMDAENKILNTATARWLDSYLTALEEACRKVPFIKLIMHQLMWLTEAKDWDNFTKRKNFSCHGNLDNDRSSGCDKIPV